jgi:hypothetical protein
MNDKMYTEVNEKSCAVFLVSAPYVYIEDNIIEFE